MNSIRNKSFYDGVLQGKNERMQLGFDEGYKMGATKKYIGIDNNSNNDKLSSLKVQDVKNVYTGL